jgi:hypothetical protein
MNNQILKELKPVYEKELQNKVKKDYTPFFVRMTDAYEGKNGVLFVGKAENMEDQQGLTIEDAFCKAQKGIINKERWLEKPTGKASRSSYNRVVQKLAKYLKQEKGINHFARTNLYKLSTTKSDIFGSEFDKGFVDIFKNEIELLQPKYVILLTGGLEDVFLQKMGNVKFESKLPFSYKNKGKIQNKQCCCKIIEIKGIDSIFITAFHPQGKPEKELVKTIKSLINNTEKI